ncbi:SpdA protein, partial [Streptomyces scopuliridis]
FHTLTRPTPHLEAVPVPIPERVPDKAPAPEPPTPAPVVAVSPAEELEPAPAPATVPPVAVAKTTRTGSGPALPAALLDAARRIADTHHAEHGTPITAAYLGTRLGIALPVATTALAQL